MVLFIALWSSLWSLFLPPPALIGVKKLPIKTSYISSDAFDHFYTIEGNSIVQYNSEGTKLKEFNERKFGRPSFIDASNVLNMLILYPNYATIIITDRNLNPLQTISFKEEGYIPLRAAALASNNTVWIYDAKEMRLKQYDFSKKLISKSDDLNMAIGKPINPTFINCQENNVYVTDPLNGVYVFDWYGNFLREFFIKGARNFQILQNQLLYFKRQQIRVFDLKSFSEMIISLPDSATAKQARVEKDRLYILRKNELTLHPF
jgi:hypothetical protein